jgi:hypothetical protein
MCCSANPDAPAEPAPLPRSRSGVPLHGRPAGASSDRDRRDPTREPCGMWRTWRRHETDTKFFDTKSDREPSYHGRAHTDTTQRAAPHPACTYPGPAMATARWCLPARPGAVRDVPLVFFFICIASEKCLLFLVFSTASPIRHSRPDSHDSHSAVEGTIVCRVHASLGRPRWRAACGRRMNPRAAAGGAGGARRP